MLPREAAVDLRDWGVVTDADAEWRKETILS